MEDKLYEKTRRKKVKGVKYFKNKKRENLTVVFSEGTKKPVTIPGKHVHKYDLSSDESESYSDRTVEKKKVNYMKYEIDTRKLKKNPTREYNTPVITRMKPPLSAKSFASDITRWQVKKE